MTQAATESELIARAAEGDDAALGRLLQLHEDRLTRHVAVRMPRSAARTFDAADIVQQTFIEAFRDFSRFEHRGEGSLFAWLKGISEHRLKNTIRSLRTQKRGGALQPVVGSRGCAEVFDLLQELAGDVGVTASWNVSREEAQSALRSALAGLPEDYRAVMVLRYFEGLSVGETADHLGRSPAAVRGLTDRAKARLRDVLIRMSLYMSVR